MKKKKCVAMLLAGGQGTRLYALTSGVAKPAVSFGSKYRIIDFTLSNCTNSGIDTVGVLTQYEPLILNEYIGSGEPWDLDRANGGVHTLSPYQAKAGGEWYKGTANAIYQNRHFLDKYDSEHVLILSGDHVYKMDYSKMLADHIAADADCTIAVFDVPKEEASRFGILSFDDSGRITAFEEKPTNPKSNHASMGVYVFKKSALLADLERDERDKNSHNDFGKDIIPHMLANAQKLFAHRFNGYWKDVGTIASLWQANMDLLGDSPALDLDDPDWRIYSRNEPMPPSYIGASGNVAGSIFTAGCEIEGEVIGSVLGEGVVIGKGSVVRNSVIMRGSEIGKNVTIDYGVIDEYAKISDGAVLGDKDSGADKITLVGRHVTIEKGARIPSGKIVE